MSTFKLTEYDPLTGITTTVHRTESKVTIQKTEDVAPLLRNAAAAREQTEGQRWGEMRHVGQIPMSVVAKFMRQDGGFDTKRCGQWLKAHPEFLTFAKFAK
jgi:hypothetical protein